MDRSQQGSLSTMERPSGSDTFQTQEAELLTVDVADMALSGARQMWESRRFLVRCSAVALISFAVLAFLLPVRFESTALLMPPDQTGSSGMAMLSLLGGKGGEGLELAGDLLGGKSSGALFVGILRSRTVENDIVSRFDLRKLYSVKYWDDARRKLATRTQISEDKKTGIITITATDSNPQRAAAIAQAYIDDLNLLVIQVSTSSARRERVFLEQRLKAVKQDLNAAATEFSQFASKNTAIDIPEQGKAMVESAARLQGELIAAQSELTGLEQIYSSNNVRVKSLRARVGELQRQLDRVGGKNIDSKEGVTADSAPELYPSIRELPLLGVRYADLYRTVKVQEVVFETLTKQYEMARVAEAKELPTVKVLDPPDIPERKSSPPRLIIMVFGACFGFIVGVCSILIRSQWRKTSLDHPSRILITEVSDHLREALHFRRSG